MYVMYLCVRRFTPGTLRCICRYIYTLFFISHGTQIYGYHVYVYMLDDSLCITFTSTHFSVIYSHIFFVALCPNSGCCLVGADYGKWNQEKELHVLSMANKTTTEQENKIESNVK